MTLSDLKEYIPPDCMVGLIEKDYRGLPFVDTWRNWISGRLKTLDIEVTKIESAGYLLLTLDIREKGAY